jgi:AAA+ superfamily predicted ATPase
MLGWLGTIAATTWRAAEEPRWLREVRLRAARRVRFLRHRWQSGHYADEQLLAITHSEVDRALEPPEQVRADELALYAADPQCRALSERIAALADEDPDPRWEHLVDTLGLPPEEEALLALALAAAIDASLGRAFGYLLDSTGPSRANPALVAALFNGMASIGPAPGSPALAWRLLVPAGSEPTTAATAGFDADGSLVPALLDPPGLTSPSARCHGEADWSAGSGAVRLDPPPGVSLHAGEVAGIAAFVRAVRAPTVEIELVGPPGSGRRSLAALVAASLGVGLLGIDARRLSGDDAAAELAVEVRRARLEGAALAVLEPESLGPQIWHLQPYASLRNCPLVFSCVERRSATPPAPGVIRRSAVLPPLSRHQRLVMWASLTGTAPPDAVARFELRPGELVAAATVAPAGEEAVAEVCRNLLNGGVSELVTRLPLPYRWDDLVLASGTEAHLREVESQARDRDEVLEGWGLLRLTPMGRGTTALFAGPSGTGKTMAAQVLARSLGLDCLRIDLAGVVSKYIGETEKQLKAVFESCERAPALLLFDEADALFGKRTQVSDAHDRYANIEIDYLLQQMERFDGLAVLATNRKGDLDTAFVRRLRFIVDFAPPGPVERQRLWRAYLEGALDSSGAPIAGALDFEALARELDLTGAGISATVLAAAFLAREEGSRIELRHVLAAARRELEKQGRVVRPGQLEDR